MDTQIENQDDILTFDTGTVDRSSPLLKDGVYDLELKSVERKKNDKKNTESLHFKFLTTRDVEAVDGNVLHKGWPIMHYVGLTPSDNYTKDSIKKAIVRVLDGIYGKGCNVPIQPLSAHEGKIVTVILETQEAKGEFGASNRIKKFVPPTKQ